MSKLKPWAVGPFELIWHANRHFKDKKDIDKRIALIGFDNAIEVSVVTFLSLHPSQRGGHQFERIKVEKWLKNFHSKLEFIEHFVSLTGGEMVVGRDEMTFFHGLRNELYHGKGGFVPAGNHLLGVRQASLWVFDTLFSVNSEELLRQDDLDTGDQPRLSSAQEFLESYIALRKTLDAALQASGQSVPHDLRLKSSWQKAMRLSLGTGGGRYSKALEAADNAREALVRGKGDKHTDQQLRSLAARIGAASGHLNQKLRAHQSEIVRLAVEATSVAIERNDTGRVGIFRQVAGSGLALTTAAYVTEVIALPGLSKRPVVLVTDRLDAARRVYEFLTHWLPTSVSVQLPLDRAGFDQCYSRPSTVTVATVQQLLHGHDLPQLSKSVLLIGYDLNTAPTNLLSRIPSSMRILFTTNTAPSSGLTGLFGDLTYEYGLPQAIEDQVAVPARIEQRCFGESLPKVGGELNFMPRESVTNTAAFVEKVARDIAAHFEASSQRKGVVVTKDRVSAMRMFERLQLGLRRDVNVVSFTLEERANRSVLLDQYRHGNDRALLIVTKALLNGIDIPAETLYVVTPLPESGRDRILALACRPAPPKTQGQIVDYSGNDWSNEPPRTTIPHGEFNRAKK